MWPGSRKKTSSADVLCFHENLPYVPVGAAQTSKLPEHMNAPDQVQQYVARIFQTWSGAFTKVYAPAAYWSKPLQQNRN